MRFRQIRTPSPITLEIVFGDTPLFSDMRLIGEDAPIDLALPPIGEHFTMGPKDAAKAVEFLAPKCVVPIHYGTFPPLVGDPQESINRRKKGSIGTAMFEDPDDIL